MKIAVLGAGFAGLAVTYNLIRYTKGRAAIDLFDPEPIGKGPSGISLGLLNPYMGQKARRSWKSGSCLYDLHRLLTVASTAIDKPIILSKGILRPAITPEIVDAFLAAATDDHNLEWWPREACMQAVHGLSIPQGGGALYVRDAWTISVPLYLEGLFRACVHHGVVFKQIMGVSQKMIDNYDKIIVCLGANSLGFKELKDLPMTPIKGQILTLKWPSGVPPLPMSLVGSKQIVMNPGNESCSVGATYERDFTDLNAHKEQVYQEIMPKITAFFPPLENAELLGCRTGVRASPKSRYPLIGQLSDKFWFFAGLGSKGLLQHAWLGKRMARAILTNDPLTHLPKEVQYKPPQQN